METIKVTKVYGFENNVVSDFLQDRYPYIENENKNKKI